MIPHTNTHTQRQKYKFIDTQIQICSDNYAPPRSGAVGHVGTAHCLVYRYKYTYTKTQIQIQKHTNTSAYGRVIYILQCTVLPSKRCTHI